MSTLKRGLSILETVAQAGHAIGFTEINTALGTINRASLSAILKELMQAEYIEKNRESGLYSSSSRMTVFLNVKEKGRTEYLIKRYGDIIHKISRKFDITVILFERVKNILIGIHKQKTESSISMQDIGNVNRIGSDSPWCKVLSNPDMDFAYDDQKVFKNIRRLGFPLFDYNNNLVGCLGIGGTILQITDKNLEQIVKFIKNQLKGA